MLMSRIRLEVHFASVIEVFSGRSDYPFWQDAKDILESYPLGIEQYESLAIDEFSDEGFVNVYPWFCQSKEDAQPEVIRHCAVEIPNLVDIMGHSQWFMSAYCICAHYRNPDA